MEEKNCGLLMEYLKDIIYNTSGAALDLETLDEPYRQLGRGMQFLQSIVEEMLTYSAELSRGNLSTQVPERDNLFCTNLKNMHATLNHMTWQAKQVARGDYSQRVDYLGEFSDAFNTMTAQLKERETQLLRETENLKRRSESIVVYNELLAKMMANRLEWILVVDAETRQVVYCNQGTHTTPRYGASPCESCAHPNPGKDDILAWSGREQQVWAVYLTDGTCLHVNSYPVEWQGRNSYVHVVSDATEMEQEKKKLSSKAYIDPVTGLYNRVYFEEYMERLARKQKTFTLGFLDIDGLKYVNDHYGHYEGDCYIRRFASVVRESFRSEDLFARVGGDEFCIVLQGPLYDLTCGKLESIRTKLAAQNDKLYSMSFSYGVVEISGQAGWTLDEVIKQADARMYKYKREKKRERSQ